MKKTIVNNLIDLMNFHINYQLKAYRMANRANVLGFPGFSHYFSIEAADAVVHTRRIMNYLMDNEIDYPVNPVMDPIANECKNIVELIKNLLALKERAFSLVQQLSENARKEADALTVRFYEWFLIDFYEEIKDEHDLLNWIAMSPADLYEIDRKMGKKPEPDAATVIKTFSAHSE